MAKIDTAFSLEINDIVDAMEANELWLEGVLKDKRAFECIDENCSAKITCKNMDTFADKRKVNPHFIMSNRENMHSLTCKLYKELEEKTVVKKELKGEKANQYISKKVCFHMKRPENHRIIKHGVTTNKEEDLVKYKIKKERNSKNTNSHKSNYYWLNSLVWYYVDAYRKGTTEQDTVEVDFGENKKYTYPLNLFFKRIKAQNEVTDTDRNHYAYYGKGKVFCRDDGGYDLVFNEKFLGSEKRVKCVINQTVIESCNYGKENKIKHLNSAIGKEKYIYVLSSKYISEKYNNIYLKIQNLDSVSISEIDLDQIDEIENNQD